MSQQHIAFIGLGNMGGPMAANLVKAGHSVTGFDLSPECIARAKEAGVQIAASAAEAVSGSSPSASSPRLCARRAA